MTDTLERNDNIIVTEEVESLSNTTVIDGVIYDNETGEQLGFAPTFPVDYDHPITEQDALWILKKTQEYDSKILAYGRSNDSARTELDALIQKAIAEQPEFIAAHARIINSNKIGEKVASERSSFMAHFEGRLKKFTQEKLSGEKGRTWATEYGSCQLTKTQAKIEIVDMDEAVKLAKALGIGDQVREEILVSVLKPAYFKAAEKALDDPEDDTLLKFPNAVNLVEAGEKMNVKTGCN